MTQISDFGYSSPKELEEKEHNKSKFDPISGISTSATTGEKKGKEDMPASKAMLIGTAQIFARAGQLNQRQIDGIGADLREPSFGGSPAKPEGEKVAENEKKAEEPKGGQCKINVGEDPKDAEEAELFAQFQAFKAGQEAADETAPADATETA